MKRISKQLWVSEWVRTIVVMCEMRSTHKEGKFHLKQSIDEISSISRLHLLRTTKTFLKKSEISFFWLSSASYSCRFPSPWFFIITTPHYWTQLWTQHQQKKKHNSSLSEWNSLRDRTNERTKEEQSESWGFSISSSSFSRVFFFLRLHSEYQAKFWEKT